MNDSQVSKRSLPLLSILQGDLSPQFLQTETLADIFRETVRNVPQKTALIFQNQSLNYSELDQWSDQIAIQLNHHGIKPGDTVGIWWPRSLELHVIILGIIKSGAAYVPLDFEMPQDRVETVLKEVQAKTYFSPQKLSLSILSMQPCSFAAVELKNQVLPKTDPEGWAYVLYTSGSTGKPKGIPITHRQICHFIRAEQSVLKIHVSDRVYQGFSVSFDMWCEETFISYLVGATLWIADSTTAKSLDALSEILKKNEITVLHAVPSLLAVIDEVSSIRLVNAGGEACTPPVLERWGTASREFFNTYGPTETTVSASIAKLKKGDSITIGFPLPNYGFAVVDEALNPLPRGVAGELVISGPGVGSGYVNRAELSLEKFISKPTSLSVLSGDKIYRTGDAAIMNEQGEVLLSGRLDDQIKLRGYRIELGEIESQLNAIDLISMAAVTLKKDTQNQDHLVAYLILKTTENLSEFQLRAHLTEHLPPYMIPSEFVFLKEMPRLPSGKIDRKALPIPERLKQNITDDFEKISSSASLSEKVTFLLKKMFPQNFQDLSQDFFNDLGGHSLLAAEFVSRLRHQANMGQVSIQEVYSHRPLQKLIDVWNQKKASQNQAPDFQEVSKWKYYLCSLSQSIALLLIYGLFAAQIFFPYLAYYYVLQDTSNHFWGFIAAILSFCFVPPLFSALTIASKWLIIGRMKEGDYPLWGSYYFRWWLVKTIQKLTPLEYVNGTPLYPLYYRMMGAKVAVDAQLSELSMGAEDLVTIGKDVSISSNVVLNNAVVEGGVLKLRKIHIADHAYLGTAAVVGGDCHIEAWGELKDLSSLSSKQNIQEREVWGGSPAMMESRKELHELPQPLKVSEKTRTKYTRFYLLLLLIFPFTVLIPLLPSIIILNRWDDAAADYNFNYLIYTPLLAFSYILLFALQSILLTRFLQKDIQEGSYPVFSRIYLKKWFSDQMMMLSLFVLHPLFATIYASPLYRALGAKIGKDTEISTASQVTHRLLEVGDGAFIADLVTLGEDDVRGQQVTLSRTRIGNKSFVGNSGLIPQGYQLPDEMLIGVLSVPPTKEQLQASNAKNWFGSPALPLPTRQSSQVFPSSLTTSPTFLRRVFRGVVELMRIVLPSSVVMSCSVLFIAHTHDLLVDESWLKLILYFPIYYLLFVGVPSFLVTVILKWLLIGRYKSIQIPMWTWKVWCSEAVTSTYEALSVPFFLEYLRGTPILSWALRLLGVKIGKRVWWNTTDVTEYDVVEVGDDVAFNHECGPQTHLFEDRVMKIGPVKIDSKTTIGSRSVILYDTHVKQEVFLGSLSLVMKGEEIPENTAWAGSPLKPLVEAKGI